MGINLMRDLGFDVHSKEVVQAEEAVDVYEKLINSLILSREEAGLKQKEVAKRMGTSQSAVSELENMSSDARFSTVLRYAQAVGAEIDIKVQTPHRALRTQRPEWVCIEILKGLPSEDSRTVRRTKDWANVVEFRKARVPMHELAFA